MRLGVLCFAVPPDSLNGHLESLCAEGLDLITADAEIQTAADATREAQRLARADCDGVIFYTVALPHKSLAADAALFLAGTPLLLVGSLNPFFAAAGALDEIGAAYDRLYQRSDSAEKDGDLAAKVKAWLEENRKQERQRGMEAAHRLYGQRLYVPLSFDTPDAALWAHQFGVRITRDPDNADFNDEGGGDADGALTAQILRLTVGPDILVCRVSVTAARHQEGTEGGTPATFARLSRRAGRYRCLMLRGALNDEPQEGLSNVHHFECADTDLEAQAASPDLYAAPGDHLGALRAACASLGHRNG